MGQLSIFGDNESIKEDYQLEDMEYIDVKHGDIFEVDGHRIMCGDSTLMGDINKLTNNHKIDMLFTDPPYNVGFNGRSGKFEIIENDKLSVVDFKVFIEKIVENIKLINPRSWYIWCNWKFYSVIQELIEYKACIVWAKNVFGMGQGYRHQHEFCLFGGWIDDKIKNESDLWFFDKDVNYMHPTQKPIGLSIRALKNSTIKGETVLDLFGGSGSTLIGAQLTNRKAYIMEIDTKYVQLILNRYKKVFGKQWVKVDES